VCRGGEDLL